MFFFWYAAYDWAFHPKNIIKMNVLYKEFFPTKAKNLAIGTLWNRGKNGSEIFVGSKTVSTISSNLGITN